MLGLRGFILCVGSLTSAACGCGSAPPTEAPKAAPGSHEETWYGWALLLPDGCDAPAEERFDGAPIGRVLWSCDGLAIMLDASPFADPLHHTASLRFRSGSPLCGAQEVERVKLPEEAAPPDAEAAYYEPVLGHALAVRREAGDRAASLVVQGDPSRCEAMARVVESLRPRGARLEVPDDELRAPGFALPLAVDGCHRHYDWAQCKPGAAADVHLRCDELRVDWWGLRPTDGLSATAPERSARQTYSREPVEGLEGVLRWRIDLGDGILSLEASAAHEPAVLDAIERARTEPP